MSSFPVDPALLEKYRTSAPRYTSYPTAVDWKSDEFEAASYPERLARAAGRGDALSVYLHLPFCYEMCLFCGCNVVITRKEERIERYLDRLERELATLAETGIGQRPVQQYHWGGGTPTHLSLAQIERVHRAITGVFGIAPGAEVAIEVDPRVTSVEQIALLAELGWNRVSMGVQDFDPLVQKAVKRVQSEAETRTIVDAARASGVASVNIDLMYGLPHQTRAGFRTTVETILDIRPERVALFHYAHVPWMKKHQTALDVDAMPSSDEKLAIFVDAVDAFHAAGYVYIGLDHFALPDDELAVAYGNKELHRNFMGYTTLRGTEMIGLGVSSIGEVDGAFVQNDPAEQGYLERVDEGGFATKRGHVLDADDRVRREVILDLMCNGEVGKSAVSGRHGIDFDAYFAEELAELAPLAADGLVRLDADAVRLTPAGQPFMRNAALPFDRYFRERQERGEQSENTFSKTL